MNVFNRVVVVILLLASVPGLVLLMVIAMFPQQTVPILQTIVENVGFALGTLPALVIAGVILLLIVVFVLLWLELRRPALETVKLTQVTGGEAELSTDSIARRLAYHIDKLADVISVTPKVHGRGDGVEVFLELETSPEVDVPSKTEEVVSRARQVIEEQMGLTLSRIRVSVKHAPYPPEVVPPAESEPYPPEAVPRAESGPSLTGDD